MTGVSSDKAEGLFSIFLEPGIGTWESIRIWIRNNRSLFWTAAAASIGIHIAMLCLFIFAPSEPVESGLLSRVETGRIPAPTIQGEAERRPLAAVYREAGRTPFPEPREQTGGPRLPELREESGRVPSAPPRAAADSGNSAVRSGRESSVGRTAHARPEAVAESPARRPGGSAPPVFEAQEQADPLKRVESLRRNPRAIGSRQVRVPTDSGTRYVPSDYFFRESPYRKISGAADGLFLAVKGFPDLEIEFPASGAPESEPGSQGRSSERAVKEFRFFPGEEAGRVPIEPPNHVPEIPFPSPAYGSGTVRWEKRLDSMMARPEGDQFRLFKREYLDRSDPDDPETAALASEFVRRNLSGAFIVVTDLSAAFDFVEEVYFNRELNREFADYWRRHPGTRTGAVFLMALASQYGFERRTLRRVFQARGEAEDFLRGKSLVSELYEKKAKAAVVSEVHDKLRRALEKRGFRSLAEVEASYLKEEEKIYRFVAAMGGAEGNAALFSLGCLAWEKRDFARALEAWNRIDEDFDGGPALREIRGIQAKWRDMDGIVPRIDAVLLYYANREAVDLLLRMVTLGRWKSRK